jgi:Hint domain
LLLVQEDYPPSQFRRLYSQASTSIAHADNESSNGANHEHSCLGRGTLIRTAHSEAPVEDLENGALVVTTNGELPVKWVGRKTIRKNASASWHPSVMPIRVSRFAIDDRTPQRDLYVSQEHCLLIDGVFIPAKYLVNGRSIAFDDDTTMSDTIEYFCVEFDTHEVIFAEGTAAESFLYTGGQIAWDNLGDYQDLYGGEHKVMSAFAPICRYNGGRAEVRGLLRLAASRFVDVRDPIQIAYDRIAARAMAIAA